jgi:xylulose-5-phosphate/fructose-6-phosphate phosphoketolase
LNYLLSSHVWRQDHNGFTHQDPGFIDVALNKTPEVVRVYLPPDANCLFSVMDHCLRSRSWASNDDEPDVVMAAAGDVPTLEILAAVACNGVLSLP